VHFRSWRLFKATPRSQDQLDEMKSIEEDFDKVQYWVAPVARNQTADFIVPPGMVSVMKDFLLERQINFEVVSEDLQVSLSSNNKITAPITKFDSRQLFCHHRRDAYFRSIPLRWMGKKQKLTLHSRSL